MKNGNTKISANEINRFIYCPYQWYYNRYYGAKALRQQYKALEQPTSSHEANFVRGQQFHQRYYKAYRRKRFLQVLIVLIAIILWIGWIRR
ncbi:hypothetical protein CS063_02595 [Sporanaerobium hydrogeniformans]|uniref:Uncharacterized protein n=1 Tax=Sporanaerobium hydrogeniformans TaxID=3072179 RepID=A0AC61DHY8_9FIRM|nr:hypothetical protein CS063_02595 [Sporanaerobium hydrogeniformans]